MRADNRGEGGILALMALAQRVSVGARMRRALALVGISGACLFFGDGVITPAISVLSAVEGLEVAAPQLSNSSCRSPPSSSSCCSPCSARHRQRRARVRPGDGGVVPGDRRCSAWCRWRATRGAAGAVAHLRASQLCRPGALGRVPRPRRRGAGRHRRRGAVCRHGPFRPPADPAGLVVLRAARAGAELFRPGRAGAGRPDGGGEPVLPAGARAGCACRWWCWPPPPPSSPARR